MPRAAHNLADIKNEVGIACVVGFHEGTYPTAEKVAEATKAVAEGATGIGYGSQLASTETREIHRSIQRYPRRAACGTGAKDETKSDIGDYLNWTRDEIIAGKVQSVTWRTQTTLQTSTGFNGAGASIENVRLMREVVDLLANGCKVKASGV